MKRWLAAIAVIVILAIGSSYILIGNTLSVSKVSVFKCNILAAGRVLSEKGSWAKWWPGPASGTEFRYRNSTYKLILTPNNRFGILIMQKEDTVNSEMELLQVRNDSIAIQWRCTLPTGNNPFKRIARYRQAVDIKTNMDTIVNHLRSFLSSTRNVYHVDVQKASVIDSNLISTRSVFPAYPTMPEVYALIKKLQDYAALEHAGQSGYPMMHVAKKDSSHFELMVAIPTDRILSDNGEIAYKHMVPGPILLAEVKGGRSKIDQAYTALENFKTDHNITSPAIPFETMVTDRLAEPDTTKWITKVYYPVIPF